MELDLRPITPDELPDFVRAEARANGRHASDEYLRHGKSVLEVDRALAAFEDGNIVGSAAAYSFELTVPGAVLPAAGIAWVAVQPTHRRKGILTQMMNRQLRDVYERGEPVAVLWATESIIYGRFGYGIGTFHENWSIERHHTALTHQPDQHGRVRIVEEESARKLFPDIYRRVSAARHGMIGHSDVWAEELFFDAAEVRRGASAYFYAIYDEDGRAEGYALYRINPMERRVLVRELMAATHEASAALWSFCFGIDRMTAIDATIRPLDDPLVWMLANPRQLHRSVRDGLWLRLVDVRAALSRRRYAQGGRLVLDVRDSMCPWNEGRFELEAGRDGAECRPTQAEADITLSIAELAAAYLGAARLSMMSHAGRVQEHAKGSLSLADAMFATQLPPWCAFDF